jgi:hypothetical protein
MRTSAKRAGAPRGYRGPRRVVGVEDSLGVAGLRHIGDRPDQPHLWSLVGGGFVVIAHMAMIEISAPTREDDLPCYG